MEDREIIELAARLEASVSGEKGIVRSEFHKSPDGHAEPFNSHLAGNRAGYLQVATIFLRAATQSPKASETAIIDVQLQPPHISIFDYKWLERREDVKSEEDDEPEEPRIRTWDDRLYDLGCYVVVVVPCLLMFVGFIVIIRWLLSLLGV